MDFKIASLPGDGVGPEVAGETIKVLKAIGKKFNHNFTFEEGLIGGVAIDATGSALTQETIDMCLGCSAVLLGAVGHPKYDDPQLKVRPEDGLLALRKGLNLFANLRPVKVLDMLIDATSLKPEVIKGVDIMVVRELTGGLYFGQPKKRWMEGNEELAVDTMAYSTHEVERIARVGFELARTRRKKLTSVDKANVLETSRLWRAVVTGLAKEYPDIELDHMLVDTCSMRLIQNPKYFDVFVTENTFGDILTDEASMLAGSMGMLPSASLSAVPKEGVKAYGMYEPIHGSAPKRAGQNKANPIATVLSGAMLLRYSLALEKEAAAVEDAVMAVLNDGYGTYDIIEPGRKEIGTVEMGQLIIDKIMKG